jgi:hypothetical protein
VNLSGYLAATRSLVAPMPDEAAIYTDALFTEGLRQALREYDNAAVPVAAELTAAGGRQQSLAGLADPVELIAVIWPWDSSMGWSGAELARYTASWRWVEPGQIWIEDGEPADGDKLLVYYRKRHAVEGLDGGAVTDVPAAHESLLVLGAAAWAVEIRYRATGEAVKAPPAEQVKRLDSWSYQRLQEFRRGLGDLARVAGPVRPVWGEIGL